MIAAAFIIVAVLGIAYCLRLLLLIFHVAYSVRKVQYQVHHGMAPEIPTKVSGVEFVRRS